jgi:hypothetical protein
MQPSRRESTHPYYFATCEFVRPVRAAQPEMSLPDVLAAAQLKVGDMNTYVETIYALIEPHCASGAFAGFGVASVRICARCDPRFGPVSSAIASCRCFTPQAILACGDFTDRYYKEYRTQLPHAVTASGQPATDAQIMRIARSAGYTPLFESISANCDYVDSMVAIGTREEAFISLYTIVRDMEQQVVIRRKLVETPLDKADTPQMRRKAKADLIIATMRETIYDAANN